VVGGIATIGTKEHTTEIACRGPEAAGDSLHLNVLVGAVVVGLAVWIFLRKDRAAGRPALGAMQAFRPLIAICHLPSMPHAGSKQATKMKQRPWA
jgi:hypothetical protein